jgi:hypothetical protein
MMGKQSKLTGGSMVNTLTSPLNTAYLNNYTQVVNHITQKGGYAIVDPHNYGKSPPMGAFAW